MTKINWLVLVVVAIAFAMFKSGYMFVNIIERGRKCLEDAESCGVGWEKGHEIVT
jgi:hypothetical protein